MNNPIETVGHDLKVAGEDVLKGFEYVGHVASDVETVLADYKVLSPDFKAELAILIQDIEPIAAVVAPVIASSGENVALDLSAIEPVLGAIKKVVSDFVSFLPTLAKAVADLKAVAQ